MKKGIVMEQHRKFTIVMTRDGLIEKARPIKNTDIGFEVNYEPFVQNQWRSSFKEKFFTMRVAALATVFLIALLPFYMITNGNEAYAYVDIDINPSMELEIDSDLEVSDIKPFNDDAKRILEQIGELEGKNIEDAIEIIINASEEEGLINQAKNVLIGVHYLKDEEKDPIIKTIENHFESKTTDWEVVTVVIPEEVRVAAEKNNQSMNKTLANTVTEQSNKEIEAIITKEDKEVLQSFFNKDKTEVEITTDDSTEKNLPSITTEKEKNTQKGNSFKDETHPSELKDKNGEINSNKNKDGHNNGKAKGHEKDKQQEKFNNGKDKKNGKANNGNGNSNDIEKSKQKDNHKGNHHKENQQKDKQKGNNGKGNNGKGNNGNNGNNGNGKNKDDGYSYQFPQYK